MPLLAGLGPFGAPELLILLVIVVLIFGVGRLPEVGGAVGRSIREFRKATKEPGEHDKTDMQSAGTTANGAGSAESGAAEAPAVFCGECGAKNAATAKFCANCGHALKTPVA